MSVVLFAKPGESQWTCLKGKWEIQDNESSKQSGFIVSEFNGRTYLLEKAELIDLDEAEFTEIQENNNREESKITYVNNVTSLIDDLAQLKFDKIVYSRSKFVESKKEFSSILEGLLESNTETFRYIMIAPNNELWLGATPEVLISNVNGIGESMALAGTQKKLNQPLEAYKWGVKEVEEHEYVVDFISTVLEGCGLSYEKALRQTSEAGPVVHLRTQFKSIATIDNLPRVLNSMHPTPAVCGVPLDKARSRILEIEERDRGYYTGYIGCLSEVRSDIFVNLRSMKKVQGGYELFIGGGITADSDPESEWVETELKASTLEELFH